MLIAQVGPYPVSVDCIRGGVESSVFGLASELAKEHQVEIFDVPRLEGNDDYTNHIHRYRNFGTHNEDAVTRVPDMVKDILSIKPDIVHIHGTGAISWTIYRALRKHNIQPMVTIHGLLMVEKWNQLKRKTSLKHLYQFVKQSVIECRFLQHIPHAIIDTEYLIGALKKYPICRLPQLHVIPQGANERYFHPLSDSKVNETPITKIILSVGTFSQRKSQIETIHAFELVRQSGVDAQLWLCGVVSEQAYYEKVKSVVETSKYKNDIFIKENLSQEELMDCYKKAHIFALHSQEESQGIVLAEAMAMGVPVISTRVGGIPYVVTEGCGLLSAYGDVSAFATNMERLLTDDELHHQYAICAREKAERYRWGKIAADVMEIYKSTTM